MSIRALTTLLTAGALALVAAPAAANQPTLEGRAILPADAMAPAPFPGVPEDQNAGGTEQFIRGVTRQGEIYDFAKTVLNETEFCGGCFSPDGETFFVHQQGDRVDTGPDPPRDRGPDLRDLGPVRPRKALTPIGRSLR
jgi:Bacterial protein of unknown function (DUF839)